MLYGPAFILAVLASFGILADVAELVWMSGVFNFALVVDIAYLVLSLYAYDTANSACRAAAATTDASCLVQADMKREWMVFFGTQGFAINMILPNLLPWKYGIHMAKNAAEQPAGGENLLVDF